MFLLLKHTYWVKKIDLAPTEQFLEYPEKLIFRDGNDVIIFTCWKVQNLLVQIWTSITLNPVDRTQLNFQENFRIYHSNDLWNLIELFSKLTNLLAKQKGYQFNWDTVYHLSLGLSSVLFRLLRFFYIALISVSFHLPSSIRQWYTKYVGSVSTLRCLITPQTNRTQSAVLRIPLRLALNNLHMHIKSESCLSSTETSIYTIHNLLSDWGNSID